VFLITLNSIEINLLKTYVHYDEENTDQSIFIFLLMNYILPQSDAFFKKDNKYCCQTVKLINLIIFV